jgi:cell division septation protein DedD
MQIREQGKQVQLIRSPYDKEKKRCVQKVAHTFKQQHKYLSDDITKYLSAEQLADLSDDEKKTLSDWLKAKTDKTKADDCMINIMTADRLLSQSADSILSAGVSAEKAAAIWAAMDKMSKALRKAGHPKKTPAPAVAAAPAPALVKTPAPAKATGQAKPAKAPSKPSKASSGTPAATKPRKTAVKPS